MERNDGQPSINFRNQLNIQTRSQSFLIDADVINGQLLRKRCRRIGATRPVAANSNVEDEMEALIERGQEGSVRRGPIVLRQVERVVHVPADFACFPLDGKDVEGVRKRTTR